MKRMMIVCLLCVYLCGCAPVDLEPQVEVPTETAQPSSQPVTTTPIGTIGKNPGLIVNPDRPVEQITEIMKNTIRKAYCDANSNVTMAQVQLRIMGVFEDTYVLFVDVKGMMYADVILKETVGGVTFVYSNSHTMQVYHDGQFYSLLQAYELDLLTAEHLQTLAYDYYAAYPNLKPEYSTQ